MCPSERRMEIMSCAFETCFSKDFPRPSGRGARRSRTEPSDGVVDARIHMRSLV